MAAASVTRLPAAADLVGLDFRRVRLTGSFLHGQEQLLVGRSYQGRAGYGVFSPLLLTDERTIFVDRGWIPLAAKSSDEWRAPDGAPISIEGVLRVPPHENSGTGASIGNEHYRLSLLQMARQAAIDPAKLVPAYLVDLGQSDGRSLPVPRAVGVEIADNHLQYALTWFALAAALVVIFLLASRQGRNAGGPQ